MDCLITCEHATNHIPRRWMKYFRHRKGQLNSHAGYDIGAIYMARCLAQHLDTTPHLGTVSRLLVDLNRSTHHPQVFSDVVKRLTRADRDVILSRYYQPYRQALVDIIDGSNDGLVHVSVHSFTPQWRGVTRAADLGLLYDPGRAREALLCRRIKEYLHAVMPELRIRRNYPYRGVADGLTTALRKRFEGNRYAGIELEFNQDLLTRPGARRRALCAGVAEAIRHTIDTRRPV